MKKKDVVDLIRYYVDGNDAGFRDLAYDIAISFNNGGDPALGKYILNLLASNTSSFTPQAVGFGSEFFKKITPSNGTFLMPDAIKADIQGILNAISYKAGVNKFLFAGPPGTGKTEMSGYLAKILGRQLYSVSSEYIIDSKLGQTGKNIASVFDEINRQPFPESLIVLFDEIDSLAMDRINSNDLREMGRATTALMKGLDELNPDVILLATTNMEAHFDNALLRRFDRVVDFSRYTKEDLVEIAATLLENDLKKFGVQSSNKRLYMRILTATEKLPYPGDLKNIIRTSIAFSNPSEPEAYLKNLYTALNGGTMPEAKELEAKGFTLREMEVLLGLSKSTLSRQLNKRDDE